jgi:hypothetical protein
MMRRYGTWVVSASIVVLVALSALPARAQTGSCQLAPIFVLLRDLLGRERVGECTGSMVRNELGDVTQPTTRGAFALRMADQVPTFSDGQTTWLYGPNGIESRPTGGRLAWETTGDRATPTPTPFATATPTPSFGAVPAATPWGQTGTTWPQQGSTVAQQQPGTTWPQSGAAPPSAPVPNALPPGVNSTLPSPAASPTLFPPTELPITLDGDDSSTSDPIDLAGGNYAVRWEARLLSGKPACYVGSRLRRFDDQNPGSLIAHTTVGSTKDKSVSGESRLFSVAPGRYVVDVATTGCSWKLVIQAP